MPLRSNQIYSRFFFTAIAILFISQFAMTQDKPQGSKTVTLRLDHVTVCGSNLDTLRQTFAVSGMAPDSGGPQANSVTQVTILGFNDSTYIELMAPAKLGATDGSELAKFMYGNDGPCAWTVVTNSIQEEVDRLKQAGIVVKAPEHRSLKRSDGMSMEWTGADVGTATPGAILPSIIEDQTPRAWRAQTSASVKDAPVTGIANVVIGVTDLDAAIALFHKAYGWSDPLIQSQKDFGKLAYFPGEPVILAAPSGGGWLSDRIGKYGESPVAILLNVRDFTTTSKKYKLSGGKNWFGQKVAWFEEGNLKSIHVGVIGQ
jgi:predicted enzyme related to lactoylglutathione lyase